VFCDNQNIYCYCEHWENTFIVVMAQMLLLWGKKFIWTRSHPDNGKIMS